MWDPTTHQLFYFYFLAPLIYFEKGECRDYFGNDDVFFVIILLSYDRIASN